MRLSPCRFQFLAAAASADAAAVMSFRRPYRGDRGRGRRSFSVRPSDGGGKDQMVSGDSHFESVSDANLGLRHGGQGGRGGFPNPNQRSYPPPHFNYNPSFRQPLPPFDRRQQPFRQHHPVPFDRNQSYRPLPQHHSRPPKPLDYREWEFSKTAPPSGSERFLVLSYNILADYLAINHRSKLYYHIPRHILDWEWRSRRILFELSLWSADIMCLQEVDRFQDLEEEMKHRGYSGIWKMRTGNAVDGCAIFWRSSRFKLVHEESIEFNKLGLRDNVAQICVLERVNLNATRDEVISPESSAGSDRIVICNIHVLYNPRRGDYKLGQVRTLLDRANSVSSLWNNAPVVLCGDFNCTPESPLYNFIKEQKLDLSGVDRDKVSGQASAEIRPSRPYNPNPGFQSANHLAQAQSPAAVQEFNLRASSSGSDTQGENISNSERENVSSVNASVLECSNIGSEVTSHSDQLTSNEIPHINGKPGTENQERDSSGDTHVVEDLSSDDRSNQENLSCQTTEIEPLLIERLNDLSLRRATESLNKGQEMVENDDTFLSALHDNDSTQLPKPEQLSNTEISVDESTHLVSEASTIEETTYDPALWTPAEIAIATGNPDSKLMEHPLQLKSSYTEVEDLSNTRDSNGEPIVTSYNRCFMGTVDYIWRSEGLQTVRVLAPIPKHAMQWTPGFPTKKWGSDHIALASELAFVKDQSSSGDR